MAENMHWTDEQNWDAGYYKVYEKGTETFKNLYESIYQKIYKKSIKLVKERTNNPLSKKQPHVLLCGTATSETSKNFVRFIQGENNKSVIKILDQNSQPLEASRIKIQADKTIDSSNIKYIKCNALKTPFADNSFDLIDNDYLMEFISPEDKPKLIKEWARILSKDGTITTRMYLPHNTISRLFNKIRIAIVEFGKIKTYDITPVKMFKLYNEAGFTVDIIPFKYGPIRPLLFTHIIAYKKKS